MRSARIEQAGAMVDVVETGSGGLAAALQAALRMTNEQFAEHLDVSVRTVAGTPTPALSLAMAPSSCQTPPTTGHPHRCDTASAS